MTESNLFFVSHVFFLFAFFGLLCAIAVVVKQQRRQWRPMLLALLPLMLIFITAYLGKHAPTAHQVFNIFYDGLLIYNAYYFWSTFQYLTSYLYIFVIISTALDFAMHFVIRTM